MGLKFKWVFILIFLWSKLGFCQVNQKFDLGGQCAIGWSIDVVDSTIVVGGLVCSPDSQFGFVEQGFVSLHNLNGQLLTYYLIGSRLQKYRVVKVLETKSGSLMLAGSFENDSSGTNIGVGCFVIKMNLAGTIEWSSESYDTLPYNFSFIRDAVLLENGNILVGGTLAIQGDSITPGVNDTDFIVFAFDSLGNFLYKKRHGNSNSQEELFCMELAKNTIFLGGRKSSVFPTTRHGRIIEIDENGAYVNSFNSNSNSYYGIYGIKYTKDNHVVYTGINGSTNGSFPEFMATAEKLDSTFSSVWDYTLYPGFHSLFQSNAIDEDSFGNIIFGGMAPGFKDDTAGRYGFLQALTSTGDSIWFENYNLLEGNRVWQHHIIEDIVIKGHQIFSCGQTIDFLQPVPPQKEMWLLNVDSLGCLIPGCHVNNLSPKNTAEKGFEVYPNPARTSFFISVFGIQSYTYFLIDNNGKTLVSGKSENLREEIPVGNLIPGVYHLKLETLDNAFVKQIVKY
jgi:Secretion system C-terminal sorting domain